MPTLLPSGIPITDLELAVLKHDLIDPEQWLRDALKGKINNCRKRMERGEIDRLNADPTVTSIPKGNALVTNALANPNYKDRVARDAAEKEALAQQRRVVP